MTETKMHCNEIHYVLFRNAVVEGEEGIDDLASKVRLPTQTHEFITPWIIVLILSPPGSYSWILPPLVHTPEFITPWIILLNFLTPKVLWSRDYQCPILLNHDPEDICMCIFLEMLHLLKDLAYVKMNRRYGFYQLELFKYSQHQGESSTWCRHGKSCKRRKRCWQKSLKYSKIWQKKSKKKRIFSICTKLFTLWDFVTLWQYSSQNYKKEEISIDFHRNS